MGRLKIIGIMVVTMLFVFDCYNVCAVTLTGNGASYQTISMNSSLESIQNNSVVSNSSNRGINYKDLIEKYPVIDLIMEFFKGIAPTAVAIVAIIVNNSFANKKEKEKLERAKFERSNKGKLDVLNNMLELYIELSRDFWLCGQKLIATISSENEDGYEDNYREFENSLYATQFKAREIYNYYKSTMELYEFRIGCHATISDVNYFANELIDICEKNQKLYMLKDEKRKNELYEDADRKIEKATVDVVAWTHVIMNDISKEIKYLNEQ